MDDTASEGMNVVSQIVQIYENYGLDTQVLVASIRHPIHILESALMAADIVTIPYKVMKSLTRHPLTDIGLAKFMADAKAGQIHSKEANH